MIQPPPEPPTTDPEVEQALAALEAALARPLTEDAPGAALAEPVKTLRGALAPL